MEMPDLFYGPTEIRTRVSAVRGQRPWPLDDGALRACKIDFTYPAPLWVDQDVHKAAFYANRWGFRGRDSNPDSTVQSRMSCLLDDPGAIQHSRELPCRFQEPPMTSIASLPNNN